MCKGTNNYGEQKIYYELFWFLKENVYLCTRNSQLSA